MTNLEKSVFEYLPKNFTDKARILDNFTSHNFLIVGSSYCYGQTDFWTASAYFVIITSVSDQFAKGSRLTGQYRLTGQ